LEEKMGREKEVKERKGLSEFVSPEKKFL